MLQDAIEVKPKPPKPKIDLTGSRCYKFDDQGAWANNAHACIPERAITEKIVKPVKTFPGVHGRFLLVRAVLRFHGIMAMWHRPAWRLNIIDCCEQLLEEYAEDPQATAARYGAWA